MTTTSWEATLDGGQIEKILAELRSRHKMPEDAHVPDYTFAKFVADEICKIAAVKNQYDSQADAQKYEFGIGNKSKLLRGKHEGWLIIMISQKGARYGNTSYGHIIREHSFQLSYSGTITIGAGAAKWIEAQKAG